MSLRASEPGSATVALAPSPDLAQMYGVIHGGVLTTLADTAAVYALQPFLAQGERMTSIELKVNFLAAAWPEKGEVVATSKVIKRGRTIAVAQVDARQGDELVLTGLFTYIVLPTAK